MIKSKWGRVNLRILRLLALVYLGALVLVFIGQRRMIYHPDWPSAEWMLKTAQQRGFQVWENRAGQFIGWKRLNPATAENQRVLVVQGNAGCAINRLGFADGLQAVAPTDVYILEYPGFGGRAGSPSQHSLFSAATEAINLLKSDGPVYLMGESLGTGVAAYLAGTNPDSVRGVLLLAPYDSLMHVAGYHMPIFPVTWMLLDKFPSAEYLANYHGPIGIIIGGQDVVVPARFGRALYNGYRGPKKLWEVLQSGHNELLPQSDDWWRELVRFWKQNAPTTAK